MGQRSDTSRKRRLRISGRIVHRHPFQFCN
jgi:hypothetical protein